MTEREPEELRVALVTGGQMWDARLVEASTLTGRFGLPVRVKPNLPEVKRVGEVGLKAGFQQTAGRPATVEGQVETKAGR